MSFPFCLYVTNIAGIVLNATKETYRSYSMLLGCEILLISVLLYGLCATVGIVPTEG